MPLHNAVRNVHSAVPDSPTDSKRGEPRPPFAPTLHRTQDSQQGFKHTASHAALQQCGNTRNSIYRLQVTLNSCNNISNRNSCLETHLVYPPWSPPRQTHAPPRILLHCFTALAAALLHPSDAKTTVSFPFFSAILAGVIADDPLRPNGQPATVPEARRTLLKPHRAESSPLVVVPIFHGPF